MPGSPLVTTPEKAMTLTGTDARRRRRRGALDKQEARAGLAMVSPTVVVIIVAVVLPVLWTVMLSFQKIRLINLRYAGVFGSYSLDNFRQVFTAPGFYPEPAHHPCLHRRRHRLVDRCRAHRGPDRAHTVSRPGLRARQHAAAVRRSGGRGDLHLGNHAERTVRHRQSSGDEGTRMAPSDPVPVGAERAADAGAACT